MIIKKLFTAIAFTLLTTSAFANTTAPTTTPPPVEATPTYSCPGNSPSWEEGRARFDETAVANGGEFVAIWTSPTDKSFAVIYDFRGAPDVNAETPFFVMVFDATGCFTGLSTFISEQGVKDAFGIVLAGT